ncbi:MAG: hypothetical protein MUF78_00290 [Candidatus Edwardsbacteria bacterium]|jgi:hypothetical protein|nr:hypothetical protein [Candidatus Edwardsbacteria bacterium]
MNPAKHYSVLVIYVQYDQGKFQSSVAEFKRYFDRCRRGSFQYCIVDNKDESRPASRLAPDEVVIGGDNSYREFSGWMRGIQYALQQDVRPDAVMFANETYRLNAGEYRHCLTDELFEFVIGQSACAGLTYGFNRHRGWLRFVTHAPATYEIKGERFNHWVRSNVLILPYRVLQRLEWPRLRAAEFFACGYDQQPFRRDAPLSASLKRKLREYLCPTDTTSSDAWHSSFPLTAETYSLFTTKATCILDEMSLVPAIRRTGAALADIRVVDALVRAAGPRGSLLRSYARLASRFPAAHASLVFLSDRLVRRAGIVAAHVPSPRRVVPVRPGRGAV